MQSTILNGYDADELKLLEIFHPYAYKKTIDAFVNDQRFAHYTTADTAMRIIQGEEVWLRKSSCMNDFMEIEYGLECLQEAYKSNKDRLQTFFIDQYPDLCTKIEERFNAWLPTFRNETFLACLSEHDVREDRVGRLSMWRAYGGTSGVALVLNGFPLINPTDALGAYTSPVAYLSKEDFKSEFCTLLDSFEANRQILNSLHEEDLIGHLFHAFRMAILCTKHPGFAEEREWRVIYTPSFTESPKIKQSIESVGGTPQRVYKIPLKNFPEENLVGIELPEFLDSVIVGPSQYPWEIKEAFSILLSNKGVTNTHDKIIVSDIPLRS